MSITLGLCIWPHDAARLVTKRSQEWKQGERCEENRIETFSATRSFGCAAAAASVAVDSSSVAARLGVSAKRSSKSHLAEPCTGSAIKSEIVRQPPRNNNRHTHTHTTQGPERACTTSRNKTKYGGHRRRAAVRFQGLWVGGYLMAPMAFDCVAVVVSKHEPAIRSDGPTDADVRDGVVGHFQGLPAASFRPADFVLDFLLFISKRNHGSRAATHFI